MHARLAAIQIAVVGWFRVPANLVLSAIAVFLVAAAVTVQVDRKGDGSEYILATESLYYDHDLVVDNLVDIFRHIELRPEGMDTPAGLTRILGEDGYEHFGLHSFYYPVACVPFYALFGYQGFYVLNALLVVVTIAAVYAHLSRTQARGPALALAAGGTFLSAAWSYVFWTQTETFYTALVALYLYFYYAGRPLRAAVCIGIAAGAQFPLALLAMPLVIETLAGRQVRTAAKVGCILFLTAAPQVFYNVHVLGALVPMQRAGLASVHNLSAEVLFRFLFDPAMGFFWFYPVALYCLVRWRPRKRSSMLVLAMLLALGAMTAVLNVYSHEVGARYASYALPVVLFCVEDIALDDWWSRAAALFAIVVGAGLAINPLDNSRDMDLRHKTFLPYRIARVLGMRENPEVFKTSSDALTGGELYSREVTADRWTRGGKRAELMILHARPGTLDLTLRAEPGSAPQDVEIGTMSGSKMKTSLPGGEITHVALVLRPEDVHVYKRWNVSYAYFTLWAEGWSPAIAEAGHPPEADDIRWLGVQLQRIVLDGKILLGP